MTDTKPSAVASVECVKCRDTGIIPGSIPALDQHCDCKDKKPGAVEHGNSPHPLADEVIRRIVAALRDTKPATRPPDEIGWLIEHRTARPHKWRTWEGGWPDWTTDSVKALRLARKVDAENMACEDPEDVIVTEHIWSTP